MTRREIVIRRGTPDDSRAASDVLVATMKDLFVRQGNQWDLNPESFWKQMEPLFGHLAVNAAEWWVAADPSDSSLVGYARSVERGGLLELSEFFVRPGEQSAGLGARLIERAFPPGRGEVRVIIATTDVRAVARYCRAGTVGRFPDGDAGPLEVVRATLEDLAELAAIEEAVVGYPRHADYPWLVAQREGIRIPTRRARGWLCLRGFGRPGAHGRAGPL